MSARPSPGPEPAWYTTAEVAAIFRVHSRIPACWDRAGRFPPGTVMRTPGGTRRYDGPYIRALLAGDSR